MNRTSKTIKFPEVPIYDRNGNAISEMERRMATAIVLADYIPCTDYWAGGHKGQLRFHDERKWLFDFAWPDRMIAVECQGGVYARRGARRCRVCGQTPTGGHTTGSGYQKDARKLNMAIALGWRVIYVTSAMIRAGTAIEDLARTFSEVAK